MGLFSKSKNKTVSPLKQMAGARISDGYRKIKTAWAESMAARTAKFTKKGWVTVLACLILLMGGYSAYLIVSGFTGAPAASLKIGSIRKPAHTGNMGEAKAHPRISETEFENIRRFQLYMDSLARDPTGKRTYDSITKVRPGLIDSVRQAEDYYKQFKNR